MEYANLNNGVKMPMAGLNKNVRYYTSTPELLEKYVQMVPPVDEQK